MKRSLLVLASIAALLLSCFSAQAQVISVSFAGDNGGGGGNFTLPSDVAGVVPVANWNSDETQLASGSLSSLVDEFGSPTTANVTWGGSANTWGGLPGVGGVTTSDEWMVNGWLDDNGTGADVQVTGIPYSAYDVYVYGSSDAGNEGRGWTTRVNGVDYFSGGEFTNITVDGSFFTSSVGFVDATTTDPDPTFFKISGLTGANLSIFGFRNQNGPVLPGGGTDYRGGISGFQIVENLNPNPIVEINRDTGFATIENLGGNFDLTGYSLLSDVGALDDSAWISVTGNYDSNGDMSVSSDPWMVITSTSNELAEGTLGLGTISGGASVNLGAVWRTYFQEDVTFELLDSGGNVISANVSFVGNGGVAFEEGDFNLDGAINALDWPTVRDGFNTSLAGMDTIDAYYAGDLTGDMFVDRADVLRFEELFDAANGPGAFVNMLPEPGSFALLGLGSLVLLGCRRRGKLGNVALLLVGALCLTIPAAVEAQSIGVSFAGDNGGGTSVQIGPTQTAGFVPAMNWNDGTGAAGSLTGLVDDAGAATTAEVTWSSANTWGGSGATTDDEFMVNGWLDDGGAGADVQVTGIPYDTYDVYVYGSSDAGNEGNGWTTQVNGTNFFSGGEFTTLGANGSFFDPGTGYVDASTNGAEPSYFKVSGLFGSTLSILGSRTAGPPLPGGGTDYRGAISGFQIVESTGAPDVLSLEVDVSTGAVTLLNNGSTDRDIDYYQITSAGGSINLAGWNSLEDQDFEGNGPSVGDGNGWEELGNLNSNIAAEFYLQGSSVMLGGGATNVDLGTAFALGGAQDWSFSYEIEGGGTQQGLVIYEGTPTLTCDFDGSGTCDIVDIEMLQSDIGVNTPIYDLDPNGVTDDDDITEWLSQASAANAPKVYLRGDGDLDGTVGGTDFTNLAFNFGSAGLWSNGNFDDDGVVGGTDFTSLAFNFGHTSVASVPEPSSFVMIASLFVVLCGAIRRKG